MGKLMIRSAGVPHVKRLQDDGTIVALIMQFGNGWWGLYDPEERRLTPGKLYSTPANAKKAFEAMSAQQGTET